MTESLGSTAEALSALSALVDAGVAPQQALELVADGVGGLDGEVLAEALPRVRQHGASASLLDAAARLSYAPRRFGEQRGRALQQSVRSWRRIAAVWGIAERAGAPLADALRRMSGMLEQLERIETESRIVASGPTSTARLLQAMPLVGVLLGALLGVDSLGVLFATPFGWGCLVVALVLMLVGARWQKKMLASLQPPDDSDGMLLLMVSLGVRAGHAADSAIDLSERMLTRAGLDADRDDERARLDRLVALWQRSGVPLLGLLDGQLDDVARMRAAALRVRAARLETLLLLPLGVCSLPAFIVVTVLPMIASILFSTFVDLR